MMVWLVEVPTPLPSPGSLIARLLRAEARQYWWMSPAVLAAGLGVWALLAAVTARVPTDARPEGVVFNYQASLVLSVFPLLLSGPLMAGLGARHRLGFWFGLPLPARSVNLLRILSPTICAWPAVVTWPLIIHLLAAVYGPVPAWVVVNSALLVGIGILLTVRTSLAAFFVFALLPLQTALAHLVPGGRPLAQAWASAFSSPWAGAVMLVAGAGLAAHVLRTHPRPRQWQRKRRST